MYVYEAIGIFENGCINFGREKRAVNALNRDIDALYANRSSYADDK